MGRPLSLDDSMIDAPLPAELKGLDVDGFPSSVQNQVAMAGICQIMSRIVKNVYTSQGSHVEGRRSFDVRVVRQLRQDLDDWRANLPGGLQLDVESPPDDLSRALIHIHLTHQQAIILLTRSFAQFYIGQEKQSSIDQPGMKFLRQSTIDCIHAARVTIHLMVLLRKQKLLSQYSFFDALYCSAALCVLFLSTKLSPPDDKTRELMREALSILWQLAHGSAFAATSLKTMTSKGFRDSHESIDGVVSYDGRDNRRSRGEMVSAPSISSFESAAKSPPATTLSTQEQGFEYYNPPGLWSTLTVCPASLLPLTWLV